MQLESLSSHAGSGSKSVDSKQLLSVAAPQSVSSPHTERAVGLEHLSARDLHVDTEFAKPSSSARAVTSPKSARDVELLGPTNEESGSSPVGQALWERVVEFVAGAATAWLFIMKLLSPLIVFIASCFLFWGLWLTYQYRKHGPWVMRSWGFACDREHLRHSFFWPSITAAVAVSGIAVVCTIIGQPVFFDNLHLWIVLVIYPVWGVLQHFLLQAVGTRNISYFLTGSDERTLLAVALKDHSAAAWFKVVACVAAMSVTFSYIHYPHVWLMRATFLLGIPWAIFYMKDRCLWPLGLYHGWVGCLFYYWFLGGDPLESILR